jgi:transposase
MANREVGTGVCASWHCFALHYKPGRWPARKGRRAIVSAILYLVRSGNHWRPMPHDLPPWQSAHNYVGSFWLWRDEGTWEYFHAALRERASALGAGGDDQRCRPGQAVDQDRAGGAPQGLDAHEQMSRRKRHVLADTQGVVLRAVVSAASVQPGSTFAVLSQRLILERTLSWWDGLRSLHKNHNYQIESSEALIYLGMSRLILRQLAHARAPSSPAGWLAKRFLPKHDLAWNLSPPPDMT